LPKRGQVATFPIDHIIPRCAGGTNDTDNLALSCLHCNSLKWAATQGLDPLTGEAVPLFHPRIDDWDLHFEFSVKNLGEIAGLSPIGRATVACLEMNNPDFVILRQLLIEIGILIISTY
jgi:hypothetical protein